MRQYFKNKVLDEQFKKDGIIKVSLLNSEEVNELLALYKTIKRPLAFKELHFNIRTDSVAEKLRVQEKLLSILQQRVTDMFTNVHLFGSCFITKGFGFRNEVAYHQDWSMTDEAIDMAFLVWCPLINTNRRNGAFSVLKGSHKLNTGVRTLNMPTKTFKIKSAVKPYATKLECKAGEALIYHPALFHATYPNRTFKHRVIAYTAVIPNEAKLLFYYKNQAETVTSYKLPYDFHINNISNLSEEAIKSWELVGEVPDDMQKLDAKGIVKNLPSVQ